MHGLTLPKIRKRTTLGYTTGSGEFPADVHTGKDMFKGPAQSVSSPLFDTYDEWHALESQGQHLGDFLTSDDGILQGPHGFAPAPYRMVPKTNTTVVEHRQSPAGQCAGCVLSHAQRKVRAVSFQSREQLSEPHHEHTPADIISFSQCHARADGSSYAMNDYGCNDMTQIVTTMGCNGYFSPYNILHPHACVPTRTILEHDCMTKSEGGLYVDTDLCFYNHDRWNTYM